jgi:4'-phosphopantetheinyl transferase
MLSPTSSPAPATTPRPWTFAPQRPRASEGVVHVWRADLAAAADGLEDLLNRDERERAARIVRACDRLRWARSRGVLRALLGRYLDRDPRQLRFVSGTQGKPGLDAETQPDTDLRFNSSHSGALALYVVTVGHEVGVDIEVARRQVDEVAVAARVLGREQASHLARLDPQARRREFLRAWVAHEAAVKCRGTGLTAPSQRPLAGELWTAELDLGPRAAAAMAVDGRGWCDLVLWEWRA